MPALCLLLCLLLWSPGVQNAETKQTLTGEEWTFTNRPGDSSLQITGKAIVPGDIYSDLRRLGLIDDPLYADNDVRLRWVTRENWTYTSTFNVDTALLKKRHQSIIFDGLDTVATVFLNGQSILKSNNQFIRYTVDVTGNLKETGNVLKIDFESPISYVERKASEYRQQNGFTVPPDCVNDLYHGECRVNYIRKIQASFSWDWGPAFPTVGVWQPVTVVAHDSFRMVDARVTTTLEKDYIQLDVEVDIRTSEGSTLTLSLRIPELGTLHISKHSTSSNKEETLNASFFVSRSQMKLWWPNGMGEQNLYTLNVAIKDDKTAETCSKNVRFGARSAELVQDFVNPSNKSMGRNFYFKVNDVPVFLKGSNWIPVSPFPAQDNSERMEFLLESARVAGMNALRVWGGGRYEHEDLYRMADEKGILIWQDLMFACALYPTDTQFLETVKTEVEYQVKRLKSHPSILLWAGNNENELAIVSFWYISLGYSLDQAMKDYVKLYVDTLEPLVKGLDNSRPFVTSSPSNGIETDEYSMRFDDPGNSRYGDVHYYNDFMNLWKDSTFPITRCATEYGTQSIPSRITMAHYLPPDEYHYLSGNFTHRQHHPGGVEFLLSQIFDHFPLPKDCVELKDCMDKPAFIDRFSYYTQFHQALAYKTETEHYLRFRGRFTESGEGNTMCALYWQLNDVWAAPTWSSVDWDLKWKPAHYEARRFFAKYVVVLFFNDKDFLEAYAVNDNNFAVEDVEVKISAHAFTNGFAPIFTSVSKVDLPPLSSISIPIEQHKIFEALESFKKQHHLSDEGEKFVYTGTIHSSNRKQLGYTSTLVPSKLQDVNLDETSTVTVQSLKKNTQMEYELELKALGIAPLVWLEVRRDDFLGFLSDNAFTMVESNRTLTITLKRPLKTDLTQADIYACSLKDCYV